MKHKKITDDMTHKEAEQLLEHKKRVLRRWAIVTGFLALAAFGLLAMDLLDRVLKGGQDGSLEINYSKVEKKIAWLGSEIRDLDATISDALRLTSSDGVLVNNVTPGSPADRAGLVRGDVILSLDGTPTVDSFQIQDQIGRLDPGDTVKLVVDTIDGPKRNVYVTLGVKPDDDTATTDTNIKKVADVSDKTADPVLPTPWGISVSPLTDQVKEQFGIPATEQGVVIVAVVQEGLADSQGLEVGDVIESINRIPTPNLQAFYQALRDDESVLMDVYSPDEDKRFFVTLPDEGDSAPQVVLMSFDEETPKTNRIVVPSDSAGLDGQVYYRFASAGYFILYDFTESKATAIQNPYAAQVRGTGITVAQMLIGQKIDAVIAGAIGPQSFDTFYLAGIKIYGPATGSVRTAITNYQLDRLPQLKEANLGGYGYSSAATLPAGGSPWTEDSEDESDGLSGQPLTIPPMGKPDELTLTAQGDARASRPETCVCPNCGAEVTHPANTSCADMVCPVCGSQLMTATPGTDSITGTDITSQLPATQIPTQLRPVSLTAGTPSRISAIPTANNLWALSNQPENVRPVQQTAATTTQVSVCICPLDGTTVTHPIGVPCSALQCPVCGGRMVSGASPTAGAITATAGIQTGGSPMVSTSAMQTSSKPDDMPPIQQAFYLVPVSSKPDDIPPVPSGQAQQVVYIPVSGGPPQENAGVGPSDAGPAVDGQSQGGGQAGAGAAQSGRATLCVCPVCNVTVTHPIGVPCASLTCPVCGSRLVNAEPGGATGGAMTPTAGMPTGGIQTSSKPDEIPPIQQAFYVIPIGGKPDDVPPVQQAFYLLPVSSKPEDIPPLGQTVQGPLTPTSGGPPQDGSGVGPSDAGPAVDGQSQGGGQAGSGAAQSGRSTLCICPMCNVAVTHPIGVPCSSLTCPVCGSRLVNAEPGGTTGGGAMTTAAATTAASTSSIVYVAGASRKVVIPSTGRSPKSDIAPLMDEARYFLMFGLGTYDAVPNPYYRDKRATGTEIAQFIVSEGGAVVICNNVSATALKALKDLKVKVYTGFVGTVQQAVEIYTDGRLKDSGSVTGTAVEDSTSEHEGGGGPPSSKDKRKEKDEAEVF
ncbi:MAG TPA: PDZ domain-containing protein [Planctomycetes bacterium]|nr:PDZ domain-containing protein [Planctomycetota bacterium]